MPAPSRINDYTTGHSCFPPQQVVTGSSNVFCGGTAIARVGDYVSYHDCNDEDNHNGTITTGSSTIFSNGLPVSRIGDSVSCGSLLAQGCNSVFMG